MTWVEGVCCLPIGGRIRLGFRLAREGQGGRGSARSTTRYRCGVGIRFSIVGPIVKVVVYRLTTVLTIESASDFRDDNRVVEIDLSP